MAGSGIWRGGGRSAAGGRRREGGRPALPEVGSLARRGSNSCHGRGGSRTTVSGTRQSRSRPNAYYFRCFSLGNQREALLCLGHCSRFTQPTGGATLPWPIRLRQGRPHPRHRSRHHPCPRLRLPSPPLQLPLYLLSLIFSHSIALLSVWGQLII